MRSGAASYGTASFCRPATDRVLKKEVTDQPAMQGTKVGA